MSLIGREKEKKEFLDLMNSDKSELVAVYGRRRVGKTYLINELFLNNMAFKHTGLSPEETKLSNYSRLETQLKAFHSSLLLAGEINKNQPKDWNEAFLRLIKLLESKNQNGRLIVFLDEFPWMDTPKSGFVAAFSWFWNNWACTRNNLMVIVCGSSSSWIINNLINAHGGLYNRLTYSIRLSPLSLHECREFFLAKGINLPLYTIASIYMVFGGIPYYLNYYDPSLSLNENIDKLFVAKDAKLSLEYNNLFEASFTDKKTSKDIVNFLAKRTGGYTRKELLEGLGISDGLYITKALSSLENSDFILKYIPYKGNGKEKCYKVIDPFCLFYLKHISNKQSLSNNIFNENVINSWVGPAFENLCYNHLDVIKKRLGISQVQTMQFSWLMPKEDNKHGSQIDLVIERKDKIINLCEMKFYQNEYEMNTEAHINLMNKIDRLIATSNKKTNHIVPVLITTFGLKKTEYWSDYKSVITLEDLFN